MKGDVPPSAPAYAAFSVQRYARIFGFPQILQLRRTLSGIYPVLPPLRVNPRNAPTTAAILHAINTYFSTVLQSRGFTATQLLF